MNNASLRATHIVAKLIRYGLRILTLACAALLAIACSRESILVGEWQCDTPEPVYLKFSKDSVEESFYNSITYTERGETHTVQWQVARDGKILFTAPRPMIPGVGFRGNARPHKIVDLTRNKFVVEWRGGQRYEFRRVR